MSILSKIFSVKASVTDSLGDIHFAYIFASVTVSDGTRHLEYARIRSCCKSKRFKRIFKQITFVFTYYAVLFNKRSGELCVGCYTIIFIALFLNFAGLINPLFDFCRAFSLHRLEVCIFYGCRFKLDINSVKHGSADFTKIALHICFTASATVCSVSIVSTFARVERHDKHSITRVCERRVCTRHCDFFVLKRLAHGFNNILAIFGKLVKK